MLLMLLMLLILCKIEYFLCIIMHEAANDIEAHLHLVMKMQYKSRKRAMVFELIFESVLATTMLIIANTNTDAREECGNAIWAHILIRGIYSMISCICLVILRHMFTLYQRAGFRVKSRVLSIYNVRSYVNTFISFTLFIWTCTILLGTDVECKKYFQNKYWYMWNMITFIAYAEFISIIIKMVESITRWLTERSHFIIVNDDFCCSHLRQR